MKFVAHGDYFGIANCWTKFPSFLEGYLIFFRYSKFSYVFIP